MVNLAFLSTICFAAVFFVVSVSAQQPPPSWDQKTRGQYFLRLQEAWNTFTNKWPLDEAQKTRASAADGPRQSGSDSSAVFHLDKTSLIALLAVGSWSLDFMNRARAAVDHCEVYADYDYRVDDTGKIAYIRAGFVKDPADGKYSLYTVKSEARCDLGTVANKKFLQCVFAEIAKQGDPKTCATKDFPASAAENFQKCAISRATAFFMQDSQMNWDRIQQGVSDYGRFAQPYVPLPKCSIGYDKPKPFDGACPKNDNQAWTGCGQTTPTPAGAPLTTPSSNVSLGVLLLAVVYLAKSLLIRSF